MKKNTYVKLVKTYLKGTMLQLFVKYTREHEIPESEYVRDLIRDDLKKRYNLQDGFKRV